MSQNFPFNNELAKAVADNAVHLMSAVANAGKGFAGDPDIPVRRTSKFMLDVGTVVIHRGDLNSSLRNYIGIIVAKGDKKSRPRTGDPKDVPSVQVAWFGRIKDSSAEGHVAILERFSVQQCLRWDQYVLTEEWVLSKTQVIASGYGHLNLGSVLESYAVLDSMKDQQLDLTEQPEESTNYVDPVEAGAANSKRLALESDGTFMVYSPQGAKPPKVEHKKYSEALAAAEEMAKRHYPQEFYVVRVVAKTESKRVIETKTKEVLYVCKRTAEIL